MAREVMRFSPERVEHLADLEGQLRKITFIDFNVVFLFLDANLSFKVSLNTKLNFAKPLSAHLPILRMYYTKKELM